MPRPAARIADILAERSLSTDFKLTLCGHKLAVSTAPLMTALK